MNYWNLKITDNGPSYQCPVCGRDILGEIDHWCDMGEYSTNQELRDEDERVRDERDKV